MPQIIVTADSREGDTVMLRERVNVTDFESEHFAAQLVERINWAVGDADELEHNAQGLDKPVADDPRPTERTVSDEQVKASEVEYAHR